MKFEDLNVTSLESWSVRGNIPSWPYDNSYFQVSELYIVFRPGPMVLVPFGNQTWQWEIYDWHWLAVLMGKSVYIYTRVYIYFYIYTDWLIDIDIEKNNIFNQYQYQYISIKLCVFFSWSGTGTDEKLGTYRHVWWGMECAGYPIVRQSGKGDIKRTAFGMSTTFSTS